jgi:hypothetical protein
MSTPLTAPKYKVPMSDTEQYELLGELRSAQARNIRLMECIVELTMQVQELMRENCLKNSKLKQLPP